MTPTQTALSSRQQTGIMIAGVLFAFSFQKYLLRDPLSQSAGLQGILEVALTLLPALIILLTSRHFSTRLGTRREMLPFLLYGIFALASSVNSFSPSMSVMKGVLFFIVLLMAYLLSENGGAIPFLRGIYRGYVLTLIFGLLLGVLSPGKYPLYTQDTFNGRTRLTLFATHPNSIGEVSGFMLLLALVLPLRAPWYTQVFLLVINLVAGEKTSTIALLTCMIIIFLFTRPLSVRRWVTASLVLAVLAAGVACIRAGVLGNASVVLLQRSTEAIYGTQVSQEVESLDGRADVWKTGVELALSHPVLGFGFGGARDALLSSVSWAGQAHNGFLEASLTAGILGASILLLGLIALMLGSLGTDIDWNARLLCLNLYIFGLAMIGPIFDSPSYLAEFVVIVAFYFRLGLPQTRVLLARATADRTVPFLGGAAS